MAAPVLLTGPTILCAQPFLVKQWSYTAGTDATAFAHGEARAPNMMFSRNGTTGPTATEVSLYSEGVTNYTLDCEAGAGTIFVYCIWFDQASGGLDP